MHAWMARFIPPVSFLSLQVTGLVGSKLPKFSIFGDTINTASRMESTCTPGEWLFPSLLLASVHHVHLSCALLLISHWPIGNCDIQCAPSYRSPHILSLLTLFCLSVSSPFALAPGHIQVSVATWALLWDTEVWNPTGVSQD